MSHLNDDHSVEPTTMMGGDPMGDNPEQDSAATVAIELLGGSTIDQALPEKKKRPIPESVALLMLVIAVAAGGLFMMRKMGLGSQLQFASVEIDYPIDGVGKLDLNGTSILENLRNNEIDQVPLSQVQKNPFQLLGDSHTVADLPMDDPRMSSAEIEARRTAENRRRAIIGAYANLNLNSILLGSTPVARISGETVRIGDVVQDLFKVKAITARAVDLEVDGKMYTLSLGE